MKLEKAEDGEYNPWAICFQESVDTVIGTCEILNIENNTAEIGFAIAKTYWGQGIAREASERIMDLLRKILPCDFMLECERDHDRTIKVANKLGFIQTDFSAKDKKGDREITLIRFIKTY